MLQRRLWLLVVMQCQNAVPMPIVCINEKHYVNHLTMALGYQDYFSIKKVTGKKIQITTKKLLGNAAPTEPKIHVANAVRVVVAGQCCHACYFAVSC